MTTIDRSTPNNPSEPSPQRVPRITVVVHEFRYNPARPDPTSPSASRPALNPSGRPTRTQPARRRGGGTGRHELDDRTWLGLAEQVLQSWPITLRVAVLMAVLFTGTAVLATVVGVAGQLLLSALGVRSHRQRRRRLEMLRRQRELLESDDT